MTGLAAALVAIVKRGLITVVSVGNDKSLVGHDGLDAGDALGIGNDPNTVHHTVFVAHFTRQRRCWFGLTEQRINATLGIGVQHEKLTGMHARMTKKLQPVGFGPGKSLFVAEHDSRGIIFKLAGANEAAAGTVLAASGDSVFLCLRIECWGRSLH